MIFSRDDKSFSFQTSQLESEQDLADRLWLTLIGINEIPPHIALISEGKYYSVSAKKVDLGSSLEALLNTLKRKKIPALFVRINSEPLVREVQSIYSQNEPLGNTNETCLSPIKTVFLSCFSPDFSNVNYVFELLALAEDKGLLKTCCVLNYESRNSNIVTLPTYTKDQIRKRITDLRIMIQDI